MANKVTTQWFDVQVKFGNYLANQKQSTLTQQQLQLQARHQQQNKLQNVLDTKNMDQLDQLQDDLDCDDQFTRQYMAKRYAEIKDKADKIKYGKLYQISRDQYVREVTQAPPTDFVILHLYQNSNQFCTLINMVLPSIAQDYGHVKFIKIIADKCIDKFPDSSCPCFIIYKAGKPVSNITNIDKHLKGNIQNLAAFLSGHGILPL